MNYSNFLSKLNPENYKLNEPLSKHSTVKIGGPADIWYEAPTTDDFVRTIKLAREADIPITVVGRGANILFSDKGVRGLVIKNGGKLIQIGKEKGVEGSEKLEKDIQSRWDSASEADGARQMYEFKDLDYSEDQYPIVEVKIDSGVDMPFVINYLITNGVTGLQWYARIPGTLGGWIYNDVHGGTHFIHEIVKDVTVLDKENNVKLLDKSELNFDYDHSRFHTSSEIILSATLELRRGDAQKARYTSIEWAKRKSVQPPISVGCIFKNIPNDIKAERGYPTTSVGYIVEHVLGMKGFRIGDAAISTEHHNFIQNLGNASATDYKAVIDEIKKRSKTQLDIELEEEIFYIGEW